MVRKKLTNEELEALAADVESHRGDLSKLYDFSHPKRLRVSADASAVLSARVPYDQLKALRNIAEREHLSLSEVTKRAIESFIAASGPALYTSEPAGGRMTLFLRDAPTTETLQPGDQQLRNDEPGFTRPDTDDTTAL